MFYISLIVASVLLYFFVFLPLRPSDFKKMLNYYSDTSVYRVVVGEVLDISGDLEENRIYIYLTEIPDGFSKNSFVIAGKPAAIAKKNGFEAKIKRGSRVELVSAPRYFWDGFHMYIVALSVEGEEVLSFDDGYAGLIEYLDQLIEKKYF